MKRLMSGALLLGAAVVAAACNNVTGDLAGGPTTISVDHNPLSFKKHTKTNLVVQNFDDQGSPLLSDAHVVGTPDAIITVEIDTAFQQHGLHYGTQFVVTGNEFGNTVITFNDAGLTTPNDTILVLPTDTNVVATLDNGNPNVGDTITLTLTEPTFRFDPKGAATVDSTNIHIVGVNADSTVLTMTAPDTLFFKPGAVEGTVDTLPITHNLPINVTGVKIVFFPGTAAKRYGSSSFAIQSTTNLVMP